MEKRKFTKKEIIALAVLIFLMISIVAVGAVIIINNVNTANYEATNTSHTTIALSTTAPSETVTEQGGTEKIVSTKVKTSHNSSKTISSKSTASTTAAKSNTNSKTTSKSSKNSSTKSKLSSSSGGEKIDVVIPETNPDHKTDDKCKINGTTCYVGDVITITLNLNVPIVLENYQGYTTYDDEYLAFVSVTPNTNGIVNNSGNKILYNASVLSGLDFTQTGTIYTAKFKVKKSGTTEIENTLQVLSDKKDKPVSFSKAKDEVAVFS